MTTTVIYARPRELIFENIGVRAVFEFDRKIYMKVLMDSESSNALPLERAVNLESGEVFEFGEHTTVRLHDCTITVNN